VSPDIQHREFQLEAPEKYTVNSSVQWRARLDSNQLPPA
jgi:hypothetical protein